MGSGPRPPARVSPPPGDWASGHYQNWPWNEETLVRGSRGPVPPALSFHPGTPPCHPPPHAPLLPSHLQPPSLSEWNPGRQRSHFQPVTVGLQTQVPASSHWRRREPGEEGTGRWRPARPAEGGASRAATHLPGGSRRAGRVSAGPSGRSSPHNARSAARQCGHGSGDSARHGRCCGRVPGQTCIPRSGRCSCRLWVGGQEVSGLAGGSAMPLIVRPCAETVGS